jgi:hypothetical protein
MTVDDLIAFHTRLHNECAEPADQPHHAEAIQLLRWCVELPCVSPDEHANAYALEALLEHSALMVTEADEETPAQERSFWIGLNAKVAERLWPDDAA